MLICFMFVELLALRFMTCIWFWVRCNIDHTERKRRRGVSECRAMLILRAHKYCRSWSANSMELVDRPEHYLLRFTYKELTCWWKPWRSFCTDHLELRRWRLCDIERRFSEWDEVYDWIWSSLCNTAPSVACNVQKLSFMRRLFQDRAWEKTRQWLMVYFSLLATAFCPKIDSFR